MSQLFNSSFFVLLFVFLISCQKEIEVNQEIEFLYQLKNKVLPEDINKFVTENVFYVITQKTTVDKKLFESNADSYFSEQ